MKNGSGIATNERTLRLNLGRDRPAATDESAWEYWDPCFPDPFPWNKSINQITASHRNFARPVHTDTFLALEWCELNARCISVGRAKERLD